MTGDDLDFKSDIIKYKVRMAYGLPRVFTVRRVPCRCSGIRTRILRAVGRHPRTHDIPAFTILP